MSPIHVVLKIAIIVFLVEGLIMVGFLNAPPIPHGGIEALVDAVLLVLLGSPPSYFWVIKPFVAARRKAEVTLRESEQDFRSLFDNATEGIFQSSPEGRFTRANPALATMLGYNSTDDLMASVNNIGEQLFVDPEHRRECMANLEKVGRFRDKQIQWRRKDGSVIWLSENVRTVLNNDGKVIHYEGTVQDISERKQAEEALRESRENLMGILDHAPAEIFLKDKEGRYILVNRRFEELFGVRSVEIQGKLPEDIHSPEFAEINRQHDRSVLETGRVIELEETATLDDGVHSFMTIKFPIRDADGVVVGLGGIATEITKRKQAEEALRESQERLSAITDNIPGSVYRRVLHADGTISYPYFSEAFSRMHGVEPKRVIADSDYLFNSLHPDDRAKTLEAIMVSAENLENYDDEHRLVGESGDITWCRSIAKPHRGENGEVIWDGLTVDITDRKRIDEELRKAHNELELRVHERTRQLRQEVEERKAIENDLRLAVEHAESANRAKSDFLAHMSHELRTPLNAIIGFSDTMKEQVFGPLANDKYEEYVCDIHDSGEHLLELIIDVLDVSTIEAGKLELTEEPIDLVNLTELSFRLVRNRAEKGRVRLSNRTNVDLPHLWGDKRRVRQVILNLLTNAIKFTPRDGEVSLDFHLNDEGLLILTVTDTGIGMTEEEIGRATEPFTQSDSPLSRKHEGTGLGLPVTKGLVEAHGGTLDIKSIPEKGTIVTVRFPPERVIVGEQPPPT